MKQLKIKYLLSFLAICLSFSYTYAQPQVETNIDAKKITIGDQARMFIKATPDKNERLIWANIPDTFNNLEIVDKGKIDTIQENGLTTYKQKLLITGWDSGMFQIPAFEFTSVPKQGDPYKVSTDSISILVQTLQVDTTKPFRPIADIVEVEYTFWDYLKDYKWYIAGGLLAIALIVFVIVYFVKNKGVKAPVIQPKKVETLHQRTMRLLKELDEKQLWQNDHIKQYYIELTDILRAYIEERFKTPAMELTTDEILDNVRRHREMVKFEQQLGVILRTADMAKFAKAQPLPQEHTDAYEYTKQFVHQTKPIAQPTEHKKS